MGWAYARYLKDDLKKVLPLEIVVGFDMRGSSPFLAREIIRALNEQGIDVVEVGKVPTPVFYYAVAFKGYAGGVMVTGCHNPKEYNGFKFCREKATLIGLGSGLEKVKTYFESGEDVIKVKPKGKMTSLPDMTGAYVEQELSLVNREKIKKLKVAADPANAIGALYLEGLFQKIPCDLIHINWELNGNMPVHDPNPFKAETLRQLQEVLKNEKADLGIATDGDGDEIVFVDSLGQIILEEKLKSLVPQAFAQSDPPLSPVRIILSLATLLSETNKSLSELV